MNSREYWEARAVYRAAVYDRKSEKHIRMLRRAYNRMQNQIIDDARQIFGGFRGLFQLTEQEAIMILKYPPEKDIIPALLKALESVRDVKERLRIQAKLSAAAYKARITRLECMRLSAEVRLAEVADFEIRSGIKSLEDLADDAYNRMMFDVQKDAGFIFPYAELSPRRVQQILKTNWSGKMFSARVWHNTKITANRIPTALAEMIMQGKTSAETYNTLTDITGMGKMAANRLIRTEYNYIANQSEAEAYEAAEIEKYRFVSVLDGRTSKPCRALDGRIFLLSEKKVGTNYPPMHPWCRSTTAPVLSYANTAKLKRIARNKNGEIEYVPYDMTYREWEKRAKSL